METKEIKKKEIPVMPDTIITTSDRILGMVLGAANIPVSQYHALMQLVMCTALKCQQYDCNLLKDCSSVKVSVFDKTGNEIPVKTTE